LLLEGLLFNLLLQAFYELHICKISFMQVMAEIKNPHS